MTKNPKKHIIAGAILAGGNAHRAGGIAKGMLKADYDIPIVKHLINEFSRASIDNIVIIANDPKPYQDYSIKIIADIRKGIGPIGGIESGLSYFADLCDAVMFMPCDMPNITAKEMLILKEAFIKSAAQVVFAETADFFWHPLCTVVHNDLKNEVSDAIDMGERKICNVWQQVKAVKVHFTDEDAFFNINSLIDADKWRKKNEKGNSY